MPNTMQRVAASTLLERYDADPGPWRPMYYPCTVPVPIAADGQAERSVTLNNQEFIWTFVGHQILGNTGDPLTSGLFQDGQYLIEFKDEQSNYQSAPICASAAFGFGLCGFQIDLPLPLAYPGTKTITWRVTNNYTRVLTPVPDDETFDVQIVIGGIANWGDLDPTSRIR